MPFTNALSLVSPSAPRSRDATGWVTFFNGTVYRERIIDVDEAARRLVWSIVDGPYEHHNASAQVVEEAAKRTRFVRIADLLPDEAGERTGGLMEQALETIKQTLEAARVEA